MGSCNSKTAVMETGGRNRKKNEYSRKGEKGRASEDGGNKMASPSEGEDLDSEKCLYAAPRDQNGAFQRPKHYKYRSGKVRFKGIEEETMPLTDDEIAMVLLPALARPEFSDRRSILHSFTDEQMLRFVRGYANNEPLTDKWKGVVSRGEMHPHAATVAEAFVRCSEWRRQPSALCHPNRTANDLLTRPLPKAESWYVMWPFYSAGMDEYGHVLFVERLADLQQDKLKDMDRNFSLEEIMLFRAQAHEAMQHRQLAESHARGCMLYKHVSVIDLKGVPLTIASVKQVWDILKPVLKLAETQYPNTLYKMFITNSPWPFRAIWQMVKQIIDPETAVKINIQGGSANSLAAFQEAGIDRGAVPKWIGGNYEPTSVLDIINAAIASGGSAQPPLSEDLQSRIQKIEDAAGGKSKSPSYTLAKSTTSFGALSRSFSSGTLEVDDSNEKGPNSMDNRRGTYSFLRGKDRKGHLRRLLTLAAFMAILAAILAAIFLHRKTDIDAQSFGRHLMDRYAANFNFATTTALLSNSDGADDSQVTS